MESIMTFKPLTERSNQVARQCRSFGVAIEPLPQGIAGYQLLWAISGCGSSFGMNITPRHESAWDTGGTYAAHSPMPELLKQYGSAAACSYGPWQVLFVNAPSGFTPSDFDDIQLAAQATAAFLNKLLRTFKPKTLAEIASCWNAGHIQNPLSPGVAQYATDLTKFYAEPLPQP